MDVSFSYYSPLLMLLGGYLAVQLAAGVAGRQSGETRERLLDLGFAIALLSAAYVVVLVVIALTSVPSLVVDALEIILVVLAAFGALLVLLFTIFELIFSRRSRRAPRT